MPNRTFQRNTMIDLLTRVPVNRGSLLKSIDHLLKTIETSENAVMIPTLLKDKVRVDAWELLFVAKILKASVMGHSDLVEFYLNHIHNNSNHAGAAAAAAATTPNGAGEPLLSPSNSITRQQSSPSMGASPVLTRAASVQAPLIEGLVLQTVPTTVQVSPPSQQSNSSSASSIALSTTANASTATTATTTTATTTTTTPTTITTTTTSGGKQAAESGRISSKQPSVSWTATNSQQQQQQPGASLASSSATSACSSETTSGTSSSASSSDGAAPLAAQSNGLQPRATFQISDCSPVPPPPPAASPTASSLRVSPAASGEVDATSAPTSQESAWSQATVTGPGGGRAPVTAPRHPQPPSLLQLTTTNNHINSVSEMFNNSPLSPSLEQLSSHLIQLQQAAAAAAGQTSHQLTPDQSLTISTAVAATNGTPAGAADHAHGLLPQSAATTPTAATAGPTSGGPASRHELRSSRSAGCLFRANSGASSPRTPGTPYPQAETLAAAGSTGLVGDPSSLVKLLLQVEQLKTSIVQVTTLLDSVVELYKKSIDNIAT